MADRELLALPLIPAVGVWAVYADLDAPALRVHAWRAHGQVVGTSPDRVVPLVASTLGLEPADTFGRYRLVEGARPEPVKPLDGFDTHAEARQAHLDAQALLATLTADERAAHRAWRDDAGLLNTWPMAGPDLDALVDHARLLISSREAEPDEATPVPASAPGATAAADTTAVAPAQSDAGTVAPPVVEVADLEAEEPVEAGTVGPDATATDTGPTAQGSADPRTLDVLVVLCHERGLPVASNDSRRDLIGRLADDDAVRSLAPRDTEEPF